MQTPATLALTRAGVDFTVHTFDADDPGGGGSYGEQAAAALGHDLGVDPERVFKTLLVEVDGRLAVGVVPVSGQLDLKALAAALGGKRASMADPKLAERTTGYVVGGISPFGQRKPLPTVLDSAASGFDTILVSAGRRGADVEVAPEDLVRVLEARVSAIGR
ncbi:Cys-tRNA(Pro) deacylase [Nocardioides mangrovicus]|uniref:Cys-tRNA(Pro)/Cys-tRNA(Cys) deacylase n=1 Tax=Nocardioides mangrovicus TaxID=2478913 RepID=A0A3L8P0K7_9ACTN|nr:Cys-tRNA(Pro) deacylase [Nocardioides mangrovicus]RLV48980.1 Cys-tRNA(Pro) deacylase [Nocardioides mangrovicus]